MTRRMCDHCGALYEPIRIDQRFHSRECHDQWFLREKQEALALYRRYRDQLVEEEDGEAKVA